VAAYTSKQNALEVHLLTLNTKRSSMVLGVVGDEHIDQNSGEPPQTRTARFAPLRAALDALLLWNDVEDEAVLPDHSMVQGVASVDASLQVSGELLQ
jgi:hypothetical protein